MLETPKFTTVLTNYIKIYLVQILLVIGVVAGYQGWKAYQRHLTNTQNQLQIDNTVYKTKITDITADYEKLKQSKVEVEKTNITLAADVEFWKKKASSIPRPPQPPDPPKDDATLIADLTAAGITFKPLTDTNYMTDRSTLPTVWTWNKQVLRVPILEQELTFTETALIASGHLIEGLNKKIVITDSMLTEADKREAIRKEQEINLNNQIKIEHKKTVVAETNGWLKFGGALLGGYIIGKNIKK